MGSPAGRVNRSPTSVPDDTVRDLYLCPVLKFLRDLLMTTPSDLTMTVMLGILEDMCPKEEVLEISR